MKTFLKTAFVCILRLINFNDVRTLIDEFLAVLEFGALKAQNDWFGRGKEESIIRREN